MKKRNSYNLTNLLSKFIVSSRPISWVNTAFPFAAGYLATGGSVNLYFFIATFYFLIPYNCLIYVINDIYDYESDANNPRKNSIEGGLLPPETHRFMLSVTAILNAVVLLYLLSAGSLQTNIMLYAIVFGALSYSVPILRFKERPFVDSVTSSFHFVSPLIFALILTGWQANYWPYVLAFFLWGCASHAFGAIQDIIADRKAGIHSIATYLGAKRTARLSLLLYVLSVALVASLGWPAIIVCLPGLLYCAMVLPFLNVSDKDSPQTNRGWKHFLLLNFFAGFVVTILLILGAL